MDSFSVRVVETRWLPIETKYVTLSHCWGKKKYVVLTSATYANFLETVPWKAMPRTFTDAIELTSLLGFNYIWIDSLCIIQDSSPDWVYEASMMAHVYSFCILNISADAAQDGDGGLFRQQYENFCSVQVELDGNKHHLLFHDPKFWRNDVEASPLGRRGWVVQEQILSPRSLHFSQDQVYWECRQERFAELFPRAPPGALKILPQFELDTYQTWRRIVEKYSKCQLTFFSDKLIAISGLARRTCTQLRIDPVDYLAGLWRKDLAGQLLWKRVGTTECTNCLVWEPDIFGAPSWSWASVNYPVEFFREYSKLTTYLKILEVETFHSNDPFGRLTGGRLLLQAPLCHLSFSDEQKNENLDPLLRHEIHSLLLHTVWDHGKLERGDEERHIRPKELYFMFIKNDTHWSDAYAYLHDCHGLVLQPTGKISGQFRQFRRLGTTSQPCKSSLKLEVFLKFCWGSIPTRQVTEYRYRGDDPKEGSIIEII